MQDNRNGFNTKLIKRAETMLNELLVKIEDSKIITNSLFGNCNVEELLDKRDSREFDLEWMRAYYELRNEFNIGDLKKEEIDSIRENSFLKAYTLSKSSDIASCVSDDFEIICKSYLGGYNDRWVNSLIMSYVNGKFPCGKLEETEGNIEQCMKKFCEN